MEKTPATMMKEFVNSQKFESTADVMAAMKEMFGEVDIRIPCDRKGEYEPQIIAKYDRNADGMEEKIIGLYACGMSQRDIAEQIKALYDVDISPEEVFYSLFHKQPRAATPLSTKRVYTGDTAMNP